jgi:hypothetical protein
MQQNRPRTLPACSVLLSFSPAWQGSGLTSPGDDAPRLPNPARQAAFTFRSGPSAIRTIADADLLPDGRIAILDDDGRRVGIFPGGELERFLFAPPGAPPEGWLIPRLVALPDGGFVLAADDGRFIFYDGRLGPRAVVPFGIATASLNGFVRHPSAGLYVAAFCRSNNKVLHRFDERGGYVDSMVEALDPPFHD